MTVQLGLKMVNIRLMMLIMGVDGQQCMVDDFCMILHERLMMVNQRFMTENVWSSKVQLRLMTGNMWLITVDDRWSLVDDDYYTVNDA